jgi:uncharacterized protein (DUF362 family)
MVTEGIRQQLYSFLESIRHIIPLEDGFHYCIKPNICLLKKANTGVTTDPRIVSVLIDFLRDNCDCQISIVESDATVNNIQAAYLALGWKRLAKEKAVNLVNLSKVKTTVIKLDGFYFKRIAIPDILVNADALISVPKLKGHNFVGITGALKNQFGCLPQKNKARYHRRISEVIVDINVALKPSLAIMDAILVLSDAISGRPIRRNLILSSNDFVAIDAAGSAFLGLNPNKIKYLRLAKIASLGNMRFKLRGDTFAFVPKRIITKSIIDNFTSAFLKLVK